MNSEQCREDTVMPQYIKKMQQLQNPNYLPMVGMGELMDMVFQSKQAIIESLLYQGTYLLAGAPKIGKSFFGGTDCLPCQFRSAALGLSGLSRPSVIFSLRGSVSARSGAYGSYVWRRISG